MGRNIWFKVVGITMLLILLSSCSAGVEQSNQVDISGGSTTQDGIEWVQPSDATFGVDDYSYQSFAKVSYYLDPEIGVEQYIDDSGIKYIPSVCVYEDVSEDDLRNYIEALIKEGFVVAPEYKTDLDGATAYFNHKSLVNDSTLDFNATILEMLYDNDTQILRMKSFSSMSVNTLEKYAKPGYEFMILDSADGAQPDNEDQTESNITMGQRNALDSASNYLRIMAFSYSGLIQQLEYEGYSNSEATYAADNCGADWYEQAVLSAKNYLDIMSFSRQGLIEQLEYDGFTSEQAVYGVEQNGY